MECVRHLPTFALVTFFAILLLPSGTPSESLADLVVTHLPPCPIHALTGFLCPGCGGTRAIAALLHGHPLTAFRLNPLLIALFPPAASYFLVAIHRKGLPRIPSPAIALLLCVAVVFGIARNLSRLL